MKSYLIQIEVSMEDDENAGTVQISTAGPVSPAAMMIAVENMMNMFAGESAAGYDRALDLLCDGAHKAKRRMT
jgi:hypothetical protein